MVGAGCAVDVEDGLGDLRRGRHFGRGAPQVRGTLGGLGGDDPGIGVPFLKQDGFLRFHRVLNQEWPNTDGEQCVDEGEQRQRESYGAGATPVWVGLQLLAIFSGGAGSEGHRRQSADYSGDEDSGGTVEDVEDEDDGHAAECGSEKVHSVDLSTGKGATGECEADDDAGEDVGHGHGYE